MKENDLLKIIRERRSVTRFTPDPVNDELVASILEAGRWAPSHINSQPWEFVVIKDQGTRKKVADVVKRITMSWQGFSQAAVAIAIAVDQSKDPNHFVEDGAVAAQNMVLMAQSLGLASFWAGVYDSQNNRGSVEAELKKLLSLPNSFRLISVLPIGYAAYTAQSKRRDITEIVHYESHGRKKD